jgi:glycosyltransferase involved in cell wall biosynthesis
VGKENKKYFIEHGLKNNQLVYAPHAIDNERFTDKDNHYETAANKWKLELNMNPSSLTVLYAGKLEDIKNPTIIVELAKKMNDHDINFILAGNGPLEKELKNMAVGNNRIKFLDFCNQKTMPVLYRLADVFILSSKSETWGLSVNEAMACGRAVIIRNTCGCAIDLVVNGKNGYIFDSEKMDTVYEHLKNLLMNKTSCEAMGKRSLQMIQPYSFENIATSVESLMEKF